MVGGADHDRSGGGGRQALIVILLVGALILLHRFAVPTGDLDPTGMLALGFVILASYTIGKLADVVWLPHITGYLLAGVIFGPSVAALLPPTALPPFDRGVINEDVIRQLSVLDTLAIALIAMTAGGELKLDGLRRGLGAITGVLTGQLITIFLLVPLFVWAVSGVIPEMALPGLGTLPLGAVIALGTVVAAISFATSPSATVAVINELGAEGPLSRTVLSSVVLKDVVVVIAFSLASAWAASAIGMAQTDRDLGVYLFTHIGGSLLLGAAIGLLFALYMRFVGQEVLLVIVGVVYAATVLATALHLDPPVLLFIAAGFTVANFSRQGEALIHNVERLSMPVYVVFFTLAGAKLHLDHVMHVAPFAVGLVLLRMLALKLGVGVGARLGGADEPVRRHGWLGFVSQAGVSLSLATIVGQTLGETGRALETLIIAGIALNELLGPVLLKVGIGLAGEIPRREEEGADGRRKSLAPAAAQGEGIPEWPEPELVEDAWGPPVRTLSDEINREVRDLQLELQAIVREVHRGPLDRFRSDGIAYLRDLRREFLRHHRRISVAARQLEEGAGVGALLHTEEAELAERWRGSVLGRSARVAQQSWTPEQLVDSIDRTVAGLPETVLAPYEPETFLSPESQSPFRALARWGLRRRRWFRAVTGREMAPRRVELRQLARYRLCGETPTKIEAVAALLIQAETHLAARTRSIFDGIVVGYDRVARGGAETQGDLEAALRAMRIDVEGELALAQEEIDRIVREGTARTERILGDSLGLLKRDVAVIGTLDLPNRKRRSSRLFRQRVRAMTLLTEQLGRIRRSVAAGYSLVGLELELVGLEARIKDALDQHVSALESDVRGRSLVQAERVITALAAARQHLEDALTTGGRTGDEMAASIRQIAQPLDRVVSEAARASVQLRDQLTDEQSVSPLLDALRRAATGLTDRYEVPSAMMTQGEWRLPPPVPVVEVPFRELVTAHIEANVAPTLIAETRDLAQKVQPFSASLVELERLVAFNVELSSGELDVVHDEPVTEETRRLLREILLGALDRNTDVVRGHADEAAGWAEELAAGMRGAVLGGVDQLRGQLVSGELSQLRIEVLRRRAAGQRLMRRAGRIGTALGRTRLALGRTVGGLLGEERIERWRHGLGLPARREEELPGPKAFAPPRGAEHLPLVYRRLFAADTIEAGDVLTGRELEIDRARRALSGEAPGTLRSVALVGQDGVGKGALSSAIVRARSWKSVRRIVLEKPATLEQVDGWLEERHEGHLIVVSGFHWLVGMRPGGFAPLRRFVEGVIDDAGRNAWLLHADQLVWEYATQVAPIDDAFPEVIEIGALLPDELEAAVLARHGLSGYGLDFNPLESHSRLDALFVRGAGRIRRPYEAYFRDLHQASGGLVRDALQLWLASIEEVSDRDDLVHVGPVPPSPQRAIRRLPEDVLLQLYQIARQGWMDARVHAHLFRVDEGTAEAQLSRLTHMGLLQRHPEDTYRIQTHLRGPVFRVLREQGWVR